MAAASKPGPQRPGAGCHPGRRYSLYIAGTVAAIGLITVIGIVGWDGASRPISTTADFVAEAGLLIATAQVVVAVVAAAATIYYAGQARKTVCEMERARLETVGQQRSAALNTFTGAVADLVVIGEAHGRLPRRRRWVAAPAVVYSPLTAFAALSRALDGVRLLGDHHLTAAASDLFDRAMAFFDVATSGASPASLHDQAVTLSSARAALIKQEPGS